MLLRPRAVIAPALAAVLALSACGSGSAEKDEAASPGASGTDTVTIYSGRNEKLVGPLIDEVEKATGHRVEVRYGESSALAAQLLEEGDRSPADVFFSQDAGALGALSDAKRLAPLDASVTDKVLPGYAAKDDTWVATSARARVVAYDPAAAPEAAQMTGIDAVLDPRYKGKVGYAPTNASFHSFVTALRVDRGEEAARDWLKRFKANEPQAYDKNGAVLAAVDSGEVSLGLINHYYWHELVKEKGADAVNARIRFLGSDDPGALINVAGAGVLTSADDRTAASEVVEWLLSPLAQSYFADTTAEYPVVAGTKTSRELTPLTELKGSSVELADLASLDTTLAMLDEVGLT